MRSGSEPATTTVAGQAVRYTRSTAEPAHPVSSYPNNGIGECLGGRLGGRAWRDR